jgi:hypothetical protein
MMVYELRQTLHIKGKFFNSFKRDAEDDTVNSSVNESTPKWRKYWETSLDCGFTSIFIGKDQPQVYSRFLYNL